jgi:hypothetical protein
MGSTDIVTDATKRRILSCAKYQTTPNAKATTTKVKLNFLKHMQQIEMQPAYQAKSKREGGTKKPT